MALDGIAVASIVSELKTLLLGGRIDKIHQPQKDEILFSVRSIGSNFKVLMSANSSHPRLHITSVQKDNPMNPPMFCMVLRKYIAGGKIVGITQPNFERIVNIEIESINEMGDKAIKKLIIEIMGKHSNIILVDENNKILDSIKRISHDTSSVREVLPGKEYFLPPSQNKLNPLNLNKEEFISLALNKQGQNIQSFIYKNYTGISPIMASEICFRASLDPTSITSEISMKDLENLYVYFSDIINDIKNDKYSSEIIYDPKTRRIVEFSPIEMYQYSSFEKKSISSPSETLESFYSQRDNSYHVQQKAHDMRRLVISNIERCVKKKDIQLKTLDDIKDKEVWKMKGELLTSNIYAVQKGMTSFTTINFYDEQMPEITIALDPTLTPVENAQKYFNKYNKAKRTQTALGPQIKQNEEELEYLEGVLVAIESATDEMDLNEIRDELAEEGFMKKRKQPFGKMQKQKKSKPMHYISSDGYHIYVGKSNIQNDELTLKFAEPTDIWLHTKNIPGSHVIVKTNGENTLPDQTLLEASNLAAFNSKGKNSSNVAVDYTQRKNVKKPKGAKPGMVIYEQNKTVHINPSELIINSLEKL